jgi:sigma-B regulation protein RsbU (phosphoserine phosphatase)
MRLFHSFERHSIRSEIYPMTPTPRRKSDSDLEAARSVHERFFPTVRPVIPGLDYYGDWRPARGGASGDYIDYFEMNDGSLGLAIGDVSGEGVPAALLTSSLHSMIRALRFARTFSLKTLVHNIDTLFSEVCPDNCYATLFVGEFDPSNGRLHYVNAGHEPPFVLRKTGPHFRTIFLEASGPVIGMLRESSYREGSVSLQPGDILVAYTDGLCEVTDRSGEEFGWPRLLKTLEDCADLRARDIVEGVIQRAESFAGEAMAHEDVTLFVGRIQEPVYESPRWREDSVAVAMAA